MGDCTLYPYADAGRFFPRDYLWMAPGFCSRRCSPWWWPACICAFRRERKPWALIAALFSAVATALVTLDYFAQVLVIQPSLEHHEMDGVALFTQYNPRGLFIAMEDLGYLFLAVAFAFLAAALPVTFRPAKAIRWTLGLAALLVGVACVGFAAGLAWRWVCRWNWR